MRHKIVGVKQNVIFNQNILQKMCLLLYIYIIPYTFSFGYQILNINM